MKQIQKIIFIFLGFLIPTTTLAHIGYVVSPEEIQKNLGTDFGFFLEPLTEPKYLGLMLITILVVLSLYFYLCKAKWFLTICKKIDREAKNYTDIYGWMMRLSLGIALIGAGTSGVFISPIQQAGHLFSSIQIFVGFLLLAGFLTGLATVAAIVLFLMGMLVNFYLIGNLDFLALALALLCIGETRPGLDHLLEIPFYPWLKSLKKYSPVVLRIGLGIAMSFLAIYEKFLNPHMSEVAVYSQHLNLAIPVSVQMWVFSAGVIELAVGLAILFGFKPRLVSAIAFVVLSTSFFYFKEAVYSHITLFGALTIVFSTNGKKLDA